MRIEHDLRPLSPSRQPLLGGLACAALALAACSSEADSAATETDVASSAPLPVIQRYQNLRSMAKWLSKCRMPTKV